jgi:hypothetical protein
MLCLSSSLLTVCLSQFLRTDLNELDWVNLKHILGAADSEAACRYMEERIAFCLQARRSQAIEEQRY